MSDAERLGLRALGDGAVIDGVTLPAVYDEPPVTEAEQDPSQRFCTEWLVCFQRAAVAALLDELLRVERIDDAGATQLAADLTYLLNVQTARDCAASAFS